MLADVAHRLGIWVSRRLLRRGACEPPHLEDQAITESLKALQTLRCENGRVSVDPAEVLDRPGYLSSRAAAAVLVSGEPRRRPVTDEAVMDELGDLVVRHMLRSLQRGNTFEEAEALLRKAMCKSIGRFGGVRDAERKS